VRGKRADATKTPLILVADDYADTRELYQFILESSGFRVIVASTGTEVLLQVRHDPPAAIVMDLSMPGLDGWQTTRLLKQSAATRSIPIVVVTAHLDQDMAKRAGCDAFLQKPCMPADLLREVRRLLA
jgi:two-component system, cell cycle response regulator DivK